MKLKKTLAAFLFISLASSAYGAVAPASGPELIPCSATIVVKGSDRIPHLDLVVNEIYGFAIESPMTLKLGPAQGMLVFGTQHSVRFLNDINSGRTIDFTAVVGNAADHHKLYGLGIVTLLNGNIERVQNCILPGVSGGFN